MIGLLIAAMLAGGIIVGYIAGSLRTFAFMGYWIENLAQVARTLGPYCGDRRW